MLTVAQILEVRRMLDQTGRPLGFSDDWSPDIGTEGLRKVADDYARSPAGAHQADVVTVSLSYEEDPVTGDVRIVQK